MSCFISWVVNLSGTGRCWSAASGNQMNYRLNASKWSKQQVYDGVGDLDLRNGVAKDIISWVGRSLRSYNIIWPNDQKSEVGNQKREMRNVKPTLAKFWFRLWFRFGCQVDWDNLIAAKGGGRRLLSTSAFTTTSPKNARLSSRGKNVNLIIDNAT